MTMIDDVGEGITITKVTKTLDDYGDASESTSTTTITGIVELLEADEEIVKSGILDMGDAVLYFKPGDSSDIKPGNRVTHNNINYVIKAVDNLGIGGTGIHGQAYLKKKMQ